MFELRKKGVRVKTGPRKTWLCSRQGSHEKSPPSVPLSGVLTPHSPLTWAWGNLSDPRVTRQEEQRDDSPPSPVSVGSQLQDTAQPMTGEHSHIAFSLLPITSRSGTKVRFPECGTGSLMETAKYNKSFQAFFLKRSKDV